MVTNESLSPELLSVSRRAVLEGGLLHDSAVLHGLDLAPSSYSSFFHKKQVHKLDYLV